MSKSAPYLQPKPPVILCYGVAALSVTAALMVARWLAINLQTAPVSLFLCAVMFSAWFGGIGPGVLAVVLSFLAFDYYFVPPIYSLAVEMKEIPRILIFALSALFVGSLSAAQRSAAESLRRARDDLDATVQDLKRSNEALQAKNAERKRVEEALRESEEQWRDVFENNPTMYFIVEPAGTVLSVNPFGAEQLGYTVNELVGHSVLNVFYEADRDAVQRNVAICLKQLGQSMSWEFRKVRKDGTVLWVRETAKAGLRARNQAIVLIACEDITDRKQAEDKLRHSEAYLAEAQRLSHTGSFGWSVSSGEIFWSEETFRIFEYDGGNCKPTLDLLLKRVHPEDVSLVQQRWDRAYEGMHFDFEHRLLMEDGSVKYVHVVAHALRDESGDLEFVGSVMDVTGTKRAFQEIQVLKDQLYKENLALKEEIDRSSMFEEIVGASPALQAVLARVAKVAPTDSTVLVTGETGTGKELIARAIHKRSQRSSRAFVNVNCAATPPSLIASALFGHEKGAFTGALQRRLGRFELAEGGTIFLDEIGELPASSRPAMRLRPSRSGSPWRPHRRSMSSDAAMKGGRRWTRPDGMF